jgi:hypothetical protein
MNAHASWRNGVEALKPTNCSLDMVQAFQWKLDPYCKHWERILSGRTSESMTQMFYETPLAWLIRSPNLSRKRLSELNSHSTPDCLAIMMGYHPSNLKHRILSSAECPSISVTNMRSERIRSILCYRCCLWFVSLRAVDICWRPAILPRYQERF